ncbi:hypothetical protein BJV77DRAFT_965734 [Russula vinacea]|nr:hypothetical protein BJV77DRAFT_965734 [Russula vinacea]
MASHHSYRNTGGKDRNTPYLYKTRTGQGKLEWGMPKKVRRRPKLASMPDSKIKVKGTESRPPPRVAPLRPLHQARGRAQEVHQNHHVRIWGPWRYYEQVNEEQQGDDEVSYLQRTADEMKGDGKLGLKRLDDQWPQTSWRDHGSVCVADCGAAMKVTWHAAAVAAAEVHPRAGVPITEESEEGGDCSGGDTGAFNPII